MITLGPFALPLAPLVLLAALTASVFVGRRRAASNGRQIENALYNVMLTGVVAARLAFVVRHWDLYRSSVLGIVDLRDGGFVTWIGVLAAAAVAVAYIWCSDIPRQALAWALASGVAVAAAGGATAWLLQRPSNGIMLPAQVFQTLNGTPLRIDAFLGKPVVVNLWASWCPPCRREMPVLQQAQTQNKDVVFVFANQGEAAADVERYLAAERIDIANVVLDPRQDIARYAGSKALPTTLFFDRNGSLADMRHGELSAASLAAQLGEIRHAGAP